jgi:SAM-dependent methyltransferases
MSTVSLPTTQFSRAESSVLQRKLHSSSYWPIVKEIVCKTGIQEGICMEINGSNCFFGIAMAQLTSMRIFLVENSEDIVEHITFHLKQNDMSDQIQLIKGTPYQIPIADSQINLIVYRKSIFNWRSLTMAFREIYRLLAPGGVAYIGDDSWNGEKWINIENKLKEYGQILSEQLNGDIWRQRMKDIEKKIVQAGISSFEISCNGEGLGIIIRRPIISHTYPNC